MMLNSSEEMRISHYLNQLPSPLTIHILSNNPQNSLCLATADIIDYTVSLSPDTLSRIQGPLCEAGLDPTILISNITGQTFGVRFSGTPSGMEYSAFIQALLDFGLPQTGDPYGVRHLLDHISQPVHAKIFVSPTCTRCPGIVDMATKFVKMQPYLSVNIIQVDQFPEAGKAHQVMGVPTTWCEPGPYVFTGIPVPEYFAAYLIQASSELPPRT